MRLINHLNLAVSPACLHLIHCIMHGQVCDVLGQPYAESVEVKTYAGAKEMNKDIQAKRKQQQDTYRAAHLIIWVNVATLVDVTIHDSTSITIYTLARGEFSNTSDRLVWKV